jgi:hypothetical protein
MGQTAMLTGSVLSAGGKIAGGYAQRGALDASASEIQQEGGESIASGIQGAIMDRRRATYVASSARARTAAGGLTTTGTSAIANVGQIRGQGEYNAQTALYQGQDRANELAYRASQMRTQGGNAVVGGWVAGMNNVLKSPEASSFFDKYAKGTTVTSQQYSGGYSDTGGVLDFISG